MKRLLFVLLMLAVCGVAFADVTAEIIGKDLDENGNIVIRTQYKLDGEEVVSRYPRDEQGRSYWVTRYTVQNFAGMDANATKARILKDVKDYSKVLIQKDYLLTANQSLDLSSVLGATNTETEASILVDENQDGTPDKEWKVKTDGSKTDAVYTPPTATVSNEPVVASILVDSNGDGTEDKKLSIKKDGTSSEEAYTPPA